MEKTVTLSSSIQRHDSMFAQDSHKHTRLIWKEYRQMKSARFVCITVRRCNGRWALCGARGVWECRVHVSMKERVLRQLWTHDFSYYVECRFGAFMLSARLTNVAAVQSAVYPVQYKWQLFLEGITRVQRVSVIASKMKGWTEDINLLENSSVRSVGFR